MKGSRLCSFVLDMLLEYCRKQNMFVDYILMDYCIALAYETFNECRQLIDSVPDNNFNFDNMHSLLNSQWSQEKYDKLRERTIFFKLTFKRNFRELIHGHETFYAHLIHSRDI